LILVVGSTHSSNAAELVKLAQKQGIDSRLIENVSELDFPELEKFRNIGISAGASTPDELIQEVKQFFLDRDFQEVVE
jgi:4-hydroxy-3-methylbut-2-enyl diphosphate reductase